MNRWHWWLPPAVAGGVLLAGVLLVVLIPLMHERRAPRWHAYEKKCGAAGFTAPQCRLLFDAAEARDADDDLALALAVHQLAQPRR
jgi:hypothetical protein